MNQQRLVYRAAIAVSLAAVGSCGRGTESHYDFERMRMQQRYDPYAGSAFFRDGMALRARQPGTVSREDAALSSSAVPATAELVRTGFTDFNIYCAPCHGAAASGVGLVGSNLHPAPASLNSDRVRGMTDGELFNTITDGYRRSPAFNWAVPPLERWAVIAYLRSLQGARR